MLYYIWVMKMASRYKFSDEEIKAIEQARNLLYVVHIESLNFS